MMIIGGALMALSVFVIMGVIIWAAYDLHGMPSALVVFAFCLFLVAIGIFALFDASTI